MNINRRRLLSSLIGGAALGAMFGASRPSVFEASGSVFPEIFWPFPVNESSFVIRRVGDTYEAIDSDGVLRFSSYDAGKVIQYAVDALGQAGGGKIFIKAGRYIINNSINIPYDYIMIEGEGHSTVLMDNIINDHLISVKKRDGSTEVGIFISNIRIEVHADKTFGDEINLVNTFIGGMENVFIEGNAKALNGLYINSGTLLRIYDLSIYNVKQNAVVFNGNNDVYLYSLIIDNPHPSVTKTPTGVNILRSDGALYIINSDIIRCRYGIDFTALGNIVWTWVISTAIDSGVVGIRFPNPAAPQSYVASAYFDHCWASTHDEANVLFEDGAIVSDIRFTACRFYNSLKSGIVIGNIDIGAPIWFSKCTIASNSREKDGMHHGIFIGAPVKNIIFENCTITNDPKLGVGRQGYGVFFNTPYADIDLLFNDLRGNMNGAIGNPENNIGKLKGNKGYPTENSGVAVVPAGQTSVIVSHGLARAPKIILATPDTEANVWVTNVTDSAFTINIETPRSRAIRVSWYAET